MCSDVPFCPQQMPDAAALTHRSRIAALECDLDYFHGPDTESIH
jgi:hypothetical protein